jgi:hypothetical protein
LGMIFMDAKKFAKKLVETLDIHAAKA